MASGWRKEIENHPKFGKQVAQLRSETWQKLRRLGVDSKFVSETIKLKIRLQDALENEPEAVRDFFRSYSFPTGSRLGKIKHTIKGIECKNVRSTLRRYVKYTARFGVQMYLRKKQPHFRVSVLPPWGAKFHVKLLQGHFQPMTSQSGPYIYEYESEEMNILEKLEKLIEVGKAKFVQIDDKDGSSVLTELEAFAYDADSLTFICHRAEQPYIICLVGEKVSSQLWREAAPAIHSLQRKYFGREGGGPSR